MPQGRVKDPEGNQSGPYDFGYIQRTEGFSVDGEDIHDLLWPDNRMTAKVIPYPNKVYKLNLNQDVTFDVEEATVTFQNGQTGTIGIAINLNPI